MVAKYLWQDYTGAVVTDSALLNAYTYSTNFRSSVEGFVNSLRWHRASTDPMYKPINIGLFDTSDQSLLFSSDSFTDTGQLGWQVVNLPAAIPIVANRIYKIAAYVTAGKSWQWVATGNMVAPPAPLEWAPNRRSTVIDSGWTYPATDQNDLAFTLDVEFEETATAPSPELTVQNLHAELERWLDSQSSAEPTSIPRLTNTTLNTFLTTHSDWRAEVRGKVGSKGNVGDGRYATLFALGELLLGLLDAIKPIIDTLPAQETQVDADHADLLQRLIALEQEHSRIWNADRTFLPALGWTQTATVQFTTRTTWAQPADRYVLHITSYPPKKPPTDLLGVQYHRRAGWWTPINGTLLADRRFIDFESQELYIPGTRLPGVFVNMNGPYDCELQAYDRTS